MNLKEIAEMLGITELKLEVATNKEGEPTNWYRHWENAERFAVSIHKDLVAELKQNRNLVLDVDKEYRVGKQGEYTAYRIVKRREYEEVLSLI